MYDLAALDAALSGTIFAGKLHFSPVTGSTNSDALSAARAGAAHGSVYFADEQLAGRGRGNHRWQSAAGQGLYVSILLRPTALSSRHLHLLPLAAGLAAARAVFVASGLAIDLRWPNDLLISTPLLGTTAGSGSSGRKTGGILVESKTEHDLVAFAVVGIGVNVHQRSFDPDLATPATSLAIETGRTMSRQELLIALLKSLQHETSGLHDPALTAMIPARVAETSTWLWNREVEVHGPQACVGVTAGLDEHGFLRVQTSNGIVTVQTGGIRAAKTD
ncbi:MAG TPA: biotin--[acetyl-CoA-carboxylase] ligase [Terracidiphilus sp.]|nr:biotin--[acetyl-CoA-carboxylase] ligase [Terracidiphilus sp.]